MESCKPGSIADLATLANLDGKVLLNELKVRYQENNIYTYVGDILVAINPFRPLHIYGDEETQKYYLEKKSANPPHIFAIADAAYQCMLGYGGRIPQNQCVLISGESGAGKTESTKLIIKQLIELCRGNTQLEQQILQVNPLLEAFGNARTTMNDNSSRFGKYIQLIFRGEHVDGAKISEYLLEKSRVVHQNRGEENFHIFYYMFGGLSAEQKKSFNLLPAGQQRYLTNGADCLRAEPTFFKKQYEELVNAMDLVGFTDEEEDNLFAIIASVLHLGNVTFNMDDNDASFVEDENGPVKMAARVLGVSGEELVGTLTNMVTFTRGEQIKRHYTKAMAEDARDAVSKALYGRLFGWIVNKINQLLAPKEQSSGEARQIGILDIFGFEHFEKNSFEQACINLANEQLQFFFNQHVFKMEQEEYVKEGIDWKEIKFVDNQPLLNLFLNKPIGILSLLDEETHFPKGTDQSLVEKLNTHFARNDNYGKSAQSKSSKFTINHYAGKVTYDATRWLDKNRDSLPPGVTEMLQSSSNALVKLIFRGQITRTGTLALQARKSSRTTRRSKRPPAAGSNDGGRKRKQTVGGQFKNSLGILMERMMSSSPIFVRCLKPNHIKVPGKFDEKYINDQLLYTGMLETIKIRREGFAVRPSFAEFVEKYKIIVCEAALPGTKENCLKILKASKITGWQIGKTKVFMKYYHLDQLSDVFQRMGVSAIKIQKVIRGFLGRQEYRRRLAKARNEAERLKHLADDIYNLNIHLCNQLQIAKQNDTKIPDSFFHTPEESEFPPVPDFTDVVSVKGSSRSYEKPSPKKVLQEIGIQAFKPIPEEADGSSSDSEFSEDEFKPVSSHNFGTPGTKQATLRWFKETQTHQIYDPVNVTGNFIAEWFHGVISRRESESLLKGKPVGCFLIRVSESRFGYTLSFSGGNRTRHYMIDQLPNKKYIIIGENKVHRSLKDLVEYHKTVKISNWDGFLTEPCGQEHGFCDYQDLVGTNFYFQLEQNKQPNTSQQHTRNPPQRRGASRLNRAPENQSRNGHVTSQDMAPPIPERSYSVAKPVQPQSSSRPLPRRPDEAYHRLLQNQHAYH
uniref:non-specific serine/threonine protein kinase n=1 Tax=Crassostrea virginica TaxID=6565 RepID=A0A8B8DWH3_CRAVI|nr:myosin-IIIb-like isoform X1 [Crassostrea virginica]